jgi:hypothetical protein
MSNFKHTPGPWRYCRENGSPTSGRHMIAGATPGYLAEVRDCGSGDVGANARLIAAAPDLLGQHEVDMVDLELLAKAIHAGDPMPELVIRVTDMLNRKRAAIAKATGESA